MDLINYLDQPFTFESDEFQGQWEELDDVLEIEYSDLNTNVEIEQVDQALKNAHLYSIATGEQDGEIRIYLYGKYMANILVMVELKIFTAEGRAEATAKSENKEFSAKILELIEAVLKNIA